MQRRQIVEAGQIVRLHEGTRERCFAPIRNGQILRHDGILSRYQVAPRREGGPRSAAKWRPRHALCAFSRSASRVGVFVPRTGARRSSLGSLHRGRWPGCSPFGGVGRCGRLFSAPPMCRAGWSRSPGGWCRWWLLSGGDLNPPRAYRPAPRKRGACAADERRRTHDATPAAPTTASPGAHCCAYAPGNAPPAADFSECAPCGHWPAGHTPRNLTGSAACLPSAYGFATRWLRRGLCASRGTTGVSPHPPALPHPGKGARGHVRCGGERAAGDGGPGIQAKHTHARKNPQARRESTPPEGTGKFPLDKLSAVVVQLSTRGRIGSGGIRCPPASARESRSGKSPEGLSAFRAFILPPTAHQRGHRRIQCA